MKTVPAKWSTRPNKEFCLTAWALRGHRLPPDPAELTPHTLTSEIERRNRPSPAKRWMTPELIGLISGVIDYASRRRGGRCVDVLAFRTGVFAVVEIPRYCGWGLGDAVRLVASRKARLKLGWPKAERVFTKRSWHREAHAERELTEIRERWPEIVRM